MRIARLVPLVVTCAVAVLGALFAPSAGGQTRAQSSGPASPPATPAATDCTVPPVEPAAFLTAIASPRAATPPSPTIATTEADLPRGEPADATTAREASATARLFLACLNANQYFRLYNLVSDDFLRTRVMPQAPDDTTLASYARVLPTAIAASPAPNRGNAGRRWWRSGMCGCCPTGGSAHSWSRITRRPIRRGTRPCSS